LLIISGSRGGDARLRVTLGPLSETSSSPFPPPCKNPPLHETPLLSFQRDVSANLGHIFTMPIPAPLTASELPAAAHAVIAAAKFPFLATMDGTQPRVRPVSPVRVDGFTVYIANLRSYGKTREIEQNPQVELCYLSDAHDQVRITGRAQVLTDAALLADIWASNPLLRRYLGSSDNPALIIYQIIPERIRFMREWALEYQEIPCV
jgi:general stress protein 26